MERSFEPRGFFSLANRLLTDSEYQRDSRIRTAIGRFYYAAFLLALKKLRQKGVRVSDDAKIHKAVIEKYMEMGLSSIGNRLDQLRERRVDADYHMKSRITVGAGRNCAKLTEYLIGLIEQA
jgi:uncharacterized protein (UPF0332 family)